jgi:threonine/homoserine/homoserine lactone efflux protein
LIGSILWLYYACSAESVQAISVDHPLAFLALATAVIATPGPDTALTIRNTLSRGRAGGVCTACGVVAGQVAWVLATAFGLAALLATSETAFGLVRIGGGAYLIVLGVSAFFRRETARRAGSHPRVPAERHVVAIRQGLISNLTNPKIAVFLPSLLPQFAGSDGEPALTMLMLGAAFAALTLGWLCLYACAVARFREALLQPRLRHALDFVTGAALVGFGGKLVFGERP